MNSSNLELWLKVAMSLLLGLTIAMVLAILLGIDYGRVLAYIQTTASTSPVIAASTSSRQIPRSAYSRSRNYRRPQRHSIPEPNPIRLDRDSSISRYRHHFEIMSTALAPYDIDADPMRYQEIHWAIHRVTIALGDYGIVDAVSYLALLQGLYHDPDKEYLCDDWTDEQGRRYRSIDWARVNWAKLEPAFAKVQEEIEKLISKTTPG